MTDAPIGKGAVELAGVVKSYDGGDTLAVDGINLKIPDGAYCCLLGPSGCGKSTILRMIAGHEDPTKGEILIGGENVVGLPPVKRRTAMMFQSYALFPHLSVRDNIAYSLRVRGMAKAARNERAEAMMAKVHLTEFADRLPAQLSGGQQQRVALARAAITEPRVLLLDEPLSALDEHLRIQMRTELASMQKDLGITFVHVTHTQMEAIALADLVVVMEKGKIKQAGSARDVYVTPRDRYVAEFMGGQNVLRGRVETVNGVRATMIKEGQRPIEVSLGGAKLVDRGADIDIAIRRDDIELLRPERAERLDGRASVTTRITGIEYQGNFVKVMLDATDDVAFIAFVPERRFYEDPLQIGDVVYAAWDVSHAHLMAK
ncbi:ABC transporter ATP-binding protein [Acuticoccus kandeliae]|uniref:ABC transporter ATP-binding protein n=1 Tax=Acuticoccus kandeliae TaxID=2073160 RepID=UPI000D3E765E|nr:ABC transporter ATP-binding protein [Acuticoccus kandeliae]